MNSYEKIMSQKGMTEFKELVTKWQSLSENIEAEASSLPIFLPDIFLVSRSGTGRTHLLKLMTEYLTDVGNLMNFYGDVRYFEFMLNYCAPNQEFTEIRRLMAEVNNAAGFRSEYKGIVFIDIDEWHNHYTEKNFLSFLEYLSDNSDDWLIVFSISDKYKKEIDNLEAVISAYLRAEKVVIEAPTTEELLSFMKEKLALYGFTLKSDAEEMLKASVELLRKNEYFDGYKTVKMIAQDIVYAVYSSAKRPEKALGAEMLSDFTVDGEYIKKTVLKIEKAKHIGF